jgi:hypothetical protein
VAAQATTARCFTIVAVVSGQFSAVSRALFFISIPSFRPMRKSLTLSLVAAATVVTIGLSAFRTAAPQASQFMQVTTIESIIPGGLGRSRMITTNADGTQKLEEMENFYSMTGINFGNIQKNEAQMLARIMKLESEGWQLSSTTAGVQSPADSQGGGIYMTRYLFKK